VIEDDQSKLPPNQSEWSWVNRQGKTQTIEQTRNILQKIMEENGISGVSIVIKQGEKWSQSPCLYVLDIGVEDPVSGKAIDANTVFLADRLGQPIIAYIVLRLVTNGQFVLDRPLYKYLPRSPSSSSPYQDLMEDARYKRLTARLILSHQSGLTDSRLTHPEKRLTFEASPGKGFRYSDEGFGFLQYVLEQKFGKSFNDLAKSLVFDPLGMKQTSFIREPRFEGHIAAGAVAGPDSDKSVTKMSGTFITNASDFTKFMWTVRLENPSLSYETYMSHIIYPEVSIRSPSILEAPRYKDHLTLPPKLSWCLGWGIYQIPRVMLGICSFIGQRNQAIESYAMIYEAEKSTAITIFVASYSQHSYTARILRELLGEMETPLSWLGF
jgi:CubicO group peptidase (beta-lactamase class C family)